MADRYGRRLPLVINLVFYSVMEVLSGLAPNFTTFLVLRSLFGIGMGGEWGVGASLAMEKVPARLRGLFSGFLQQGYAVGSLLASLCYFALFERTGWRPLFFLGGLPALLAIFVQVRVKESEVWKAARTESWLHLGRAVAGQSRLFVYLVLLMTAMNFCSHGTQDMYPTFLQRQWEYGPSERAILSAISMVGAVAGGVLFGLISDRFGRRRAMLVALLGALLLIPLWAFSPTRALLALGGFGMQFMVQGAWGVIPAHLTELSPDSVRGFLPGFSYQCGALLAGSAAWIEARLARNMPYAHAMAVTAGLAFIFAGVMTAIGQERHGTAFAGRTE
jgi:SHS family lactate transporter-like MFS transporter